MLQFKIKELKITALIDSGASLCLLCPETFEKLKKTEIKIHYLSRQVTIHTLNDSSIPFRNCVKIKYRLAGKFVTTTFFVTKEPFRKRYHAILGYDFLSNNHIIIDCKKKALKFNEIEIPLGISAENAQSTTQVTNISSKENSQTNHANPASDTETSQNIKELNQNENVTTSENKNAFISRLSKKTKIDINETKILHLTCPNPIMPNEVVLFEPIKNKTGIQTIRSIHKVDQNNQIHIPVTNNNINTVTLNKKMKMGEISTNIIIQEQKNIENNETKLEINNLSSQEIKELRKKEVSEQDFNVEHLENPTKEKMVRLLLNHTNAFSKSYKTLGKTSIVTPKFKLLHSYPIQTKPYKIPHNIKDQAKKELQDLLDAGIIEVSDSKYAFPVIFVKKKNSGIRMTIDYRTINEIIEPTPYPIPEVKSILQSMSGKKFYTIIDFHNAFLQLKLREQDKQKLAFITEFGHFQPTTLNFGTKISTSVFAKLIDKVLGKFSKENVQWFVDDVIVGTNSEEEMLKLLDEILTTLEEHNLTIDPRKIHLCKREIEFLGFKLNEHGYTPSEKNVNKIQNLARPKTKKAVKQFLGLVSYFRSLIHNFSEIVNPLTELTKQTTKFKWTEKEEEAFKKIQKAILEKPTLKPPDYKKEFYILTDASKIGISAILAQKHGDCLAPIEFYARKLKESESKYHSLKLELLAIHEAVMHFRGMLLGKKITILTDSKALTQFPDLDKQPDIIARWIIDLQEFDITLSHIPGEKNPSDFISRHVLNMEIINKLESELFKGDQNLTIDNIRTEQHKDKKLKDIIEKIKLGKTNKLTKKYAIQDNTLILKQKNQLNENYIYIAPDTLKQNIIQCAHAPHFGFKKTYEFISEQFYWVKMYQDVKHYCAICTQCNTYKARKTIKIPWKKMSKDFKPAEALHIDIVGKLNTSLKKNNYILTIIDTFSRYLDAIPLRNTQTTTILNALNNYFGTNGLAKYLIVDNGSYFRSKEFQDYCRNLSIEVKYTSIYKASTNGLIEKSHRILKESIAAMCKDCFEWDIRLTFFKLHYNASKHRSTGYKPAFLFFGRNIRTPFLNLKQPEVATYTQYVKQIKEHIIKTRQNALQNMEKTMEEYNKNSGAKPRKLNIGDQVYLKCLIKQNVLGKKFSGPYEIKRIFRNDNYLLKSINVPNTRPIKIHVTKLFQIPRPQLNYTQAA